MSVFDTQIALALRLIKKNGQLVTWVKQNVTRSPTQPWKTTPGVGTDTTFPVSIVFLSSGPKMMDALFHLMKGTSVPVGAPRGLMAQVPFVPELNDKILKGTDTFNIASIDIVAPNGDPILYKLGFS